jgi:beta-glucanase (GH16 family)
VKRTITTVAAVVMVSSLLTACAKGDPGPPPLSHPASTTFSFDTPAPTPSATTPATTTAAPKRIVTARGTSTAWSEDFTGRAGSAPDPTLLQFRTGGNGWGNKELESYTARSSNASLDGKGHLAVQAVRETYTGADKITREWTSARLDSLGRWSFTTGTLSVRLKLPGGQGMWPAFWVEGANLAKVGWPNAGEIDIVEALGGHNSVFQSVHGPDGTVDGYAHSLINAAPKGTSVASAYHVFSVTRTHDKLVFRIDGALTGSFTPSGLKAKEKWAFNQPMFMTLNLAVGGWPGSPTAATPSPSSLLVDWIRFAP